MVKTASAHKITLCTYGDTMRVPGSKGQSLLKARSRGADIRMVYSSLDALEYAIDHPGKEVVFFAIGFETTAPTTAVAIQKAAAMGVRNFSVYCCHVLTPAAMMHLMSMPVGGGKGTLQVDGVIGPSHVSTIIGTAAYNRFVEKFKVPVVIAGFEPLDVLQSIFMLVRQINHGHAEVENQFSRVVTGPGNLKARRLMEEIFELRGTFEWRGLGEVPHSALKIRDNYEWFDAEKRFSIEYHRVLEPKACECAAILCGVKQPADCRLFGHACIPEHPVGACMVSSEGACAAYYSYGRFRKADS